MSKITKAKKSAKKTVKTETAESSDNKALFCCNCKYVGRKSPACEQFK